MGRVTRVTKVAKVVTRVANLYRMGKVVRGERVVNPFMRQKSSPVTAAAKP